MGVINLTLFFR